MADTNLQVRFKHPYKTEAEWEATTTIPKAGEILLTKNGPRHNYRKTGDGIHKWSELEYDLPTVTYPDLQPLLSKIFTGVIGTTNSWAGAVFFFGKIMPTSYQTIWKIKYRIRTYVPDKEGYDMSADVMISGTKSSLLAYSSFNVVGPYYPAYYHELYRAKQAGVTNEYGHALGVRFFSAYSPTDTNYKRTIVVDILEMENCSFEFYGNCLSYANIPGSGSTNYDSYSEINYVSNGLQESGDANDPNYQNKIYYTSRKAYSTIYRYQLILTKSPGEMLPINAVSNDVSKTKALTTESFNPFGEIYFYNSTSTVGADANIGNATLFRQILMDLRYSFNCGGYNDNAGTLTAREPLYLVAVPQNDGSAKLYTEPLSQTLPTIENGLIYIYLGMVYEDGQPYRIELEMHHPIYWYKDGAVRPYFLPEATHDVSGFMSKTDKVKIDTGVGNAKQFTGTCSSAANATAKVVTCTAFTADDLVKGTRISVYFDNTNIGARENLTLNVNNTGAKSIRFIYNGSYTIIPDGGYIKAGQIYNFTYDGTYWVVDMMQNSNTYPEYLHYRNNTYAKKAIAANRWIVGDKDGYEEIASGVTFDLSYPILYCSGAVSQGSSNYANMFMQDYDLNLGNLKSGFTSSAKKMIYLVVTISGNTATVDSSIITDTLPSTDDDKAYITLGRLGNQSSGANYFLFQAVHPIFVYRKGQIRLYSGSADIVNGHTVEADVPSNAVFTDTKVTQKLYTANNNMPLLMSYNTINATTTDVTNYVHRNNNIYANPSTGAITATHLKSTHASRIRNNNISVANAYISGYEFILYTGIKFANQGGMPIIHITGFDYSAHSVSIDLLVNFYMFSDKIQMTGAIDNGGWHPDIYLFKYQKNNIDYIALAVTDGSQRNFMSFNADVLDVQGSNANIDLTGFSWDKRTGTEESVIPTPDNGVTCIQVPYKINYNPKPTLTIQGNSTNIGTYNGADAATINITKSSIGLGNVENKSSATIRGELTASNVTTALGYTPVANNTTAYVYYGGNDTGLGSGTTAANAKTYFSDASKVPAGMVKFFYNNSGTEYTTVFSKAPNSSYGAVLKWGYGDQYLRILRYQASSWKSDDWEKIYAGYADSAGYTTNLRSSIVDINSGGNVDNLLTSSDLTFTRVSHLNIGWGSNDGLILNIPWSTLYGRQIALDDGNNWMATRAKNNTSGWTEWDRILTKSYGDTLYLSKTGTHAHTVLDLSFGTKGLSGTLDPITAYNIGPSASNKTFGLPAEAITVEYSTDAGATWQDYGLSDYAKKALFAETREQWIYAGKNSTSGQGSTNYWLRVTIYPSDGRYAYVNGLYLWVNRAGVTATVDLQRSTRGNPDTFTEVFSGQDIAGWSGNNIRYFSSNSFGGSTGQTSNGYKYRMIFKITSITDANYGTLSVSDIRFLGSSVFSWPGGNYMMKHNRLYNWDADLNATFPAKLTAPIIQAPIIQTGTDSTSYFQSQKFRGQGDANTYLHALDFGYAGHNQWDFYEYGGIYNFWKNTGSGTSTAVLLGKITANGWEGNVVGNVTGNATTADEAKALITLGDKRSVATTPNDYPNKIVFAGLKNKATINSPSNNTYSYIVGLRGWADSSGGKAHEIAFNDTGIFTRMGATTEWESWRRLLDSVNYSSYALPITGGTLSGNLLFNQDVRGSRFPAHYYHNLYSDTDGTVYVHYYIPGTSHTNTKAEFRVKSGDTYKRLTFSGDGSFYWDTQIVLHAGNYMNYVLPLAGGTLTGDLTLSASSGNSPAIIFQRGSLTDSLNDWEIRDKSGFLYFGQRGSNSTAFDSSIYLDNSGGVHATTFSGSFVGTNNKSGAGDGKTGVWLNNAGNAYLVGPANGGSKIHFYYNQATSATSYIHESASGTLKLYNNVSVSNALYVTANTYVTGALGTGGRTAYNDTDHFGCWLATNGEVHLAGSATSGGAISFHYNKSASVTSYIKETASGTITVGGHLKTTSSENIYGGSAIGTGGRTSNTDVSTSGSWLTSDGCLSFVRNATSGGLIQFHFNSAASATSTIDETASGRLKVSGELYTGSNIVIDTNAKYIHSKFKDGTNRILCGVNADNENLFGYGSFNDQIGSTHLQGNTVSIKSRSSIYLQPSGTTWLTVSAGNAVISTTAGTGVYYKVKNSHHEGSLYVSDSSTGNFGLYSNTLGKWVFYTQNTNGYLFLPTIAPSSTTSGGAGNLFISTSGRVLPAANSSKRYKHDIQPLTDYQKVLDIPVVSFKYNEGYLMEGDCYEGLDVPGLIAEDVARCYPIAAMYENNQVENWNIRHIVPAMLAVEQDHEKQIKLLTERVEQLSQENERLKQKIEAIA